MENLGEYVVQDTGLSTLIDRMHENKTKVFLLTNSGYEYTDVNLFLNILINFINLSIFIK